MAAFAKGVAGGVSVAFTTLSSARTSSLVVSRRDNGM